MPAPWLRNGSTQAQSSPASVWSEHVANDNRVYYWNSETKTASWDKPDALKTAEELGGNSRAAARPTEQAEDWKEYETPDGKKYYHNHVTEVTTWDKPEVLVLFDQQKQQSTGRAPTNGNATMEDDIEEQAQQELERLDRINVVGADGKAISAAMYALSDEAVPTFKTTELAEEAFHKMLRKTGVQTDWSWEQTMRAAIKDPVWRALPTSMARKNAFEQYVVDLKKATIGKQKNRIEKLKQDFERMLRRHDEIRYYSLWQNIKGNLEGEVAYKAAIDEEERIAMFNTYVAKLQIEEEEAEKEKKQSALAVFSDLLGKLDINLTTTWNSIGTKIREDSKLSQAQNIEQIDMLLAFEEYIKNLERKRIGDLKVKKAIARQEQRTNRKNFMNLLQDLKSAGEIYAGSKWKDARQLFKDRSEYLNLIGQPGSSPMDFFWDICEEMEEELRGKKKMVYDVLDAKKAVVDLDTSFPDFQTLMAQDNRTSHIAERDLQAIYGQLQDRARRKAEDEKKAEERRIRRKQDDLRSAMKKLDPPIGVRDTYEDVRIRISMLAEFTALTTEESRETAFNKYIRRLKERIEEEEERAARRERHRHAASPTRDRRERERRSSRESRRSGGHDDRDGHDTRRRHRDERRGSIDRDPRSPKRTKHEHKPMMHGERPKPADEPMLDYGGSVQGNMPADSAQGTKLASAAAALAAPSETTNGQASMVAKSADAAVDDASEDGEIAE